jgi:DNA-binding NtrC family response regulator
MAKILVVDDEMGIRELLSEILEDESHDVLLAPHATAARAVYASTALDLVLLDIWMPDTDGMSLLREWVASAPLRCPVVMMSGHASIDTALEANNLGAAGFLEKPITLHRLLSTVHKVLTRSNNLGSAVNEPRAFSAAAPAAVHADTGMSADDLYAPTDTDRQPQLKTFDTEVKMVGAMVGATSAHSAVTNAQNTGSVSAGHFSDWQVAMAHAPLVTSLREFREASERIYFQHLLAHTSNSMTKVSEISGLERTHLYRKLKQLDITFKRQNKYPTKKPKLLSQATVEAA